LVINYNDNNNKIMLTIPIIHVSKFSAKCVSIIIIIIIIIRANVKVKLFM
jgi:hypothetical protein